MTAISTRVGAMSCMISSKADPLRDAMGLVDEMVTMIRNRGHTRQDAMRQAALALGISERRVKALSFGEAFAMAQDELQKIKLAYLDHLDTEADDLARRREAIREKRRQLILEI